MENRAVLRRHDYGMIPRWDFSVKRRHVRIKRNCTFERCEFYFNGKSWRRPLTKFNNRAYQDKLINDSLQAWADGNKVIMAVLPTGGGKCLGARHTCFNV